MCEVEISDGIAEMDGEDQVGIKVNNFLFFFFFKLNFKLFELAITSWYNSQYEEIETSQYEEYITGDQYEEVEEQVIGMHPLDEGNYG